MAVKNGDSNGDYYGFSSDGDCDIVTMTVVLKVTVMLVTVLMMVW